jgi:hypothetical protein
MAAFVIVTAAPFVAVADSQKLRARGDSEGDYDVRVWNLDPKRRSGRKLTLDGATKSLTLTDS